MFTGIIEELGEISAVVAGVDSALLTVRGQIVLGDVKHGDSICVSGVCLTVVDFTSDSFTADVMRESLQRSALADVRVGTRVNLERAMVANGRFGGHIVQGHVDGTGRVLERQPGERWEVVTIELPAPLSRYVVAKGSITVDGISLTVSALGEQPSSFQVSLIPATLAATTLGSRAVGERVNLEVDVLAKYVERLLTDHPEVGPTSDEVTTS
jgi:riboflavin synthase